MPAVIVTAWNEADRLADTLRALKAGFPDARIVVADDASTDATPHVALQEEVELVRAPARVGKGGVANLAVEHLRAEEPLPVTVLCDGDLGSSAAHLPALVEALDGADLAVASFARRVGGGFGVALGFARWAIRDLTGLELGAPISGQRALTPTAITAATPFAPGFGMEIGMTVDAHRAGLRLVEVELDLEHRATKRTAPGFLHRARQLRDFFRVYLTRRAGLAPAESESSRRYARQQHQDRGDDADDRRQSEGQADHVDQRGHHDGNQNPNHP